MGDVILIQVTDGFGFHRGKRRLKVHGPAQCEGEVCCVHNPSDHHMHAWLQCWRGDKGVMERLCPHGVGHPDPDDLAYHAKRGETWQSVHGCDGCCVAQEAA